MSGNWINVAEADDIRAVKSWYTRVYLSYNTHGTLSFTIIMVFPETEDGYEPSLI